MGARSSAGYQIDLVKSGEHNPTGMMWVRTPARRHSVAEEMIPLESVAPTVLEMFGVRPPEYMRGEPIAA